MTACEVWGVCLTGSAGRIEGLARAVTAAALRARAAMVEGE